jgi:hypothetical protein
VGQRGRGGLRDRVKGRRDGRKERWEERAEHGGQGKEERGARTEAGHGGEATEGEERGQRGGAGTKGKERGMEDREQRTGDKGLGLGLDGRGWRIEDRTEVMDGRKGNRVGGEVGGKDMKREER